MFPNYVSKSCFQVMQYFVCKSFDRICDIFLVTTNSKPQNYSSTNKYEHNSKPKWHLKSFHSEFNIKQIHTFNLSQIIKTQIYKHKYTETNRDLLTGFCSVAVRSVLSPGSVRQIQFFPGWMIQLGSPGRSTTAII